MKKKQTPARELCITGAGLATSVGHDYITACASIRAGLRRSKKLNNYYVESKEGYDDNDDGLVSGHPVLEGDYDDMKSRMFTLLSMALNDLVENAGLDESQMAETPLYLAFPERDRVTIENPEINDLIQTHSHMVFSESGFRTYFNGHAGMIIALSEAAKNIRDGLYNRVLIAGTDSLIGFNDLSRYEKQERLKTILNTDGFNPGEAASAILIEIPETALKRKAGIKCIIRSISTAHEDQPVLSGKLSNGTGLAKAVTGLMDHEKNTPVSAEAVISDMNGEPYRFSEWAMIQPGIMNRITGEKKLIYPARNIGDTGAASSGIALCIAARAMEKGYLSKDPENRAGQAMILSSSDTGERGAVLIGPYKKDEQVD